MDSRRRHVPTARLAVPAGLAVPARAPSGVVRHSGLRKVGPPNGPSRVVTDRDVTMPAGTDRVVMTRDLTDRVVTDRVVTDRVVTDRRSVVGRLVIVAPVPGVALDPMVDRRVVSVVSVVGVVSVRIVPTGVRVRVAHRTAARRHWGVVVAGDRPDGRVRGVDVPTSARPVC